MTTEDVISRSACTDPAEIVRLWEQTFTRGDAEAMASLYSSDATCFFTSSPTLAVGGRTEVHRYFASAFARGARKATTSDIRTAFAAENVVVLTCTDLIVPPTAGETIQSSGRLTFVVSRKDGRWQIIHFHRSTVPSA